MVFSNQVGQVKTFPPIKIYPFEKEIWFMFTCNLGIIWVHKCKSIHSRIYLELFIIKKRFEFCSLFLNLLLELQHFWFFSKES